MGRPVRSAQHPVSQNGKASVEHQPNKPAVRSGRVINEERRKKTTTQIISPEARCRIHLQHILLLQNKTLHPQQVLSTNIKLSMIQTPLFPTTDQRQKDVNNKPTMAHTPLSPNYCLTIKPVYSDMHWVIDFALE